VIQIWLLHSEGRDKSPLKILEKRERGCMQVLPNFFGCPQLSQGRVKLYELQIWPEHSQGPSEQRALKNFVKRERGYPGSAFFGVPLLSQKRVIQFLYGYSQHQWKQKPKKKFGKSSRGVLRDSRNISGHPYRARAHRAVIFAIAQLSCLPSDAL